MESATPRAQAVMRRYRDAYQVANVIIGVGDSIKTVGVIVAALFGLLGLIAVSRMGVLGLLTGLFSAALLGILSWLSGVLLNPQGQQLLAALDGAVGSSPFLTDEERAATMKLP